MLGSAVASQLPEQKAVNLAERYRDRVPFLGLEHDHAGGAGGTSG